MTTAAKFHWPLSSPRMPRKRESRQILAKVTRLKHRSFRSAQSFQCHTQIVLNFPWQFVHDHKVHYKRLAGGVEFVDIIPKNPSGKLLRRFLREKAKEIAANRPEKAKL